MLTSGRKGSDGARANGKPAIKKLNLEGARPGPGGAAPTSSRLPKSRPPSSRPRPAAVPPPDTRDGYMAGAIGHGPKPPASAQGSRPGSVRSVRSKDAARRVLERQQFQSVLSKRLQLELRKSPAQAKAISARLAKVAPRDQFAQAKSLDLEKLIALDTQRRKTDAAMRAQAREAEQAAAAERERAATAAAAAAAKAAQPPPLELDAPEFKPAFEVPRTARSAVPVDAKKGMWAAMLKYEDERAKEQDAKAREKQLKKQEGIRVVLDRQLAEKAERKAMAEKEKKQAYQRMVQLQLEEEAASRKALEERLAKNARIKVEREKELMLERERQRRALEQRRVEERLLVQAKLDEEAAARQAEVEKRRQEAERLVRVKAENEVIRQKKLEAKRQQEQEEARLAEEQIRLVEKQEARRKAELEEVSRRIQAKVDRMADVYKKVADVAAADEERAQQVQAEHERKKAAEAAAKKAAQKKAIEDQHAVLAAQIAEKERIKRERVQAGRDEKERIRLSQLEAAEKEKREAEEQRAQAKAYIRELEKQMLEKGDKLKERDETPAEKALNARLLSELQQRPSTARLLSHEPDEPPKPAAKSAAKPSPAAVPALDLAKAAASDTRDEPVATPQPRAGAPEAAQPRSARAGAAGPKRPGRQLKTSRGVGGGRPGSRNVISRSQLERTRAMLGVKGKPAPRAKKAW